MRLVSVFRKQFILFYFMKVTGDGSRTPQKNNNLVSKAMEYVFGW